MGDRSTAFLLAGVTILAWMLFWGGLVEMIANTHPESPTSHAAVNLLHGTNGPPAG